MKQQILIIGFLLLTSLCFSQSKYEKLDSIFTELKQLEFTGGFLIAEEGKIKYINTTGFTNLKDSIPIDINSVYELASVSKQFTAAAIALLEQDKLLDINQSIGSIFPQLSHYSTITIKDLVHHTSGLAEYGEGDWTFDKKGFITNDSIINYLAKVKPELLFEPGSQYEYSNTAYVLLASIVEKVSKKSFAAFLKERIFEPAYMYQSQIHRSRFQPSNIPNYANGFVFADSLSRNILPDDHQDFNFVVYLDGIQGDGMVNSTLIDLLKWDRALYGNAIFSDATKQKLFEPVKLNNGEWNNYAYGWGIKQDSTYGKIVSHSGGWPGYVTYIERHIDTDKTIIILQNNFNNTRLKIKSIRKILYNIPLDPPKKVLQIPVTELKKYTGKFEFEDDKSVMTIKLLDDKLHVNYGEEAFNILPTKQHVFFVEGMETVEMIFEMDEKGVMNTAKWLQGSYVGNLKRVE